MIKNEGLTQCEKPKELLIMNPLLNSKLHKYIWIDNTFKGHRAAQQLFDYLLKKKICIEGFATNVDELFQLKMYNKEIYNIHTLDETSSIVFCDLFTVNLNSDTSYRIYNARIVNSDIGKQNLAIWGTGKIGISIYDLLKDNGKEVKCFIEDDGNLKKNYKYDIPVYTSEQSYEVIKPLTVIEAVEKWEELDRNIQGKFEKRFYTNLNLDKTGEEVICNDGTQAKRLFCLKSFWMFNHFVGKKIYIYGWGIAEKEFAEYLLLLDYNFVGFLVDELDLTEDQTENPVQYVEEVLFEEDYYIWAYDKKKAKKLNELGLQYFKDYYVKDYRFDVTINQRTILDINLGNNYLSDSKYPGMLVYGDEKDTDFKIVALGGSTTDGTMYPFKSWPLMLYEELGEGVTVYNGGVCSYTSGQELIKLIRDVIQLKPDMVIVYDGYNNLAFNNYAQYPFSFNYLEKVFGYAKTHIEDDEDIACSDGNGIAVCRGIESGQGRFSNWMRDIRAMHAIAVEENIKFLSFCQPILCSKKGKTSQEKNILLSMDNEAISLFRKESFRTYMNQIKDMPEYMYDLSHIFDGEENVYMDVCHVWENGNRIIAREIKKIILPEVKVDRK